MQKSNLNREPDRIQTLVNKLQSREPFVLKGQSTPTQVIDPDPSWLNDLMLTGQLKTDYILDTSGNKVPLSTLQKTVEFGSTGRLGTEKETVQLNRLDQLIKEAGHGEPISIKVGSKIYRGCVGAKNTPGTPKSDFEILDDNGQSIIFISHKDGNKSNDFGQWSGMTNYLDYPEITNFIADVKKKVGKRMPPKTTFARPLKSRALQNKACFGKDYGLNNFNINNVTCILQGVINFKKVGNIFNLVADKIWLNGNTPSVEYTPTLMAIYKGKSRRDFQIEGARFSIYPKGGRKSIPI